MIELGDSGTAVVAYPTVITLASPSERLPPLVLPAVAPSGAPTRASGAVLGALMIAANLLGYVFVLIATRSLGPEEFGAFSAVNSSGLLLAIPVGAIQVVVARRQTLHPGTGLWLAGVLGAVLVLAGAAVSLFATGLFHLDSARTVILAMANLLPMSLTAALQGVLLGRGRLVAFGLSVLFTALTRILAVAAVGQHGIDWLFGALLIAGVAGAVLPAWQARREIATLDQRLGRGAVRELLRANRTLGALVALSTVDLLLARHYLPARDAGAYALGSVFSKVVMWGTQFLALGIVPALHPSNSRKRVLEATGFVVVLGAIAVGATAATAPLLVRVVGGTAYGHADGILVWFVVLGTLLGLAQVLLYAGMATDDGRLGILTWLATAALVAVVVRWQHDHAYRILGTALAATAVVVVIGLVAVVTDKPDPLTTQEAATPLSEFAPVVGGDPKREA